jgi:hypothetical protein
MSKVNGARQALSIAANILLNTLDDELLGKEVRLPEKGCAKYGGRKATIVNFELSLSTLRNGCAVGVSCYVRIWKLDRSGYIDDAGRDRMQYLANLEVL